MRAEGDKLDNYEIVLFCFSLGCLTVTAHPGVVNLGRESVFSAFKTEGWGAACV